MATYQAIAAVSAALCTLLESAAQATSEFASVQFEAIQTRKFEPPKVDTVTWLLYRIAPNANRRSVPPRRQANGLIFRPALAIDLHYLLTAWTDDAAQQQLLLGWCLRTLEDTPSLPAGLLNVYGRTTLAGTEKEQIFGPSETVEMVLDNVSLQDMVNILEPFNKLPFAPVSVAYLARMIPLESQVPLTEAEPVQTRELQYWQVTRR